MTTPVSLVPAAVPATTGAAPAAAPDDVFASVLAALSGALGLPVQAQPQPLPDAAPVTDATPAPAVAATAAVATTAVPAGTADASPAVWTAVVQRPVLAPQEAPTPVPTAGPVGRPVAPARPTTTAAGGAPATAEAPADVAAPAPAVDRPRLPEAAAPAVPAVQGDPVVAAAAAPAPVTAPAPVEAPRAEVQVAPTHHVKPALVEAARGLRHEGGGRTSLVVRLDPPELGAVLVRLTVQDGRVDVTLRTPDLAARADLQAQSYDVEQVLREQGFDLSSFDVAQGDVLPDGWGDAPDRGTPERGRRADGQPHTSVTDDGPAPEPSGTWL